MNNYKPGGGGHMQLYKGKGNGDESGEYTDESLALNNTNKKDKRKQSIIEESKQFCRKYRCTVKELERTIGDIGCKSIELYTNSQYGIDLNQAAKNKTLTQDQALILDIVVDSIKRHYITHSLLVERGIKTTEDVLEAYRYAKEHRIMKFGGPITSVTRDENVAYRYAFPDEDRPVSIVFECELPANYVGLPVEDIAQNRNEKEILLASPAYYVDDIEEREIAGIKYNIIKISIARY